MDIFHEINKLPQYLYVLSERELILGGQSCPDEKPYMEELFDLWKKLQKLYEKESLTDGEKEYYAELVHKMEVRGKRGTYKQSELKEIIESLSEEEKEEAIWQIEMYKRGREYCRKYN